jgi:hypothetical protein
LNSGPQACLAGTITTWATLPSLFCAGYSQDRVSWTICSSWLPTTILLIAASWVARITGMSHQRPGNRDCFVFGFLQVELVHQFPTNAGLIVFPQHWKMSGDVLVITIGVSYCHLGVAKQKSGWGLTTPQCTRQFPLPTMSQCQVVSARSSYEFILSYSLIWPWLK